MKRRQTLPAKKHVEPFLVSPLTRKWFFEEEALEGQIEALASKEVRM